MLSIYARTFMIATMADAWGQPASVDKARARGRSGWLGAAWRRVSGGHARERHAEAVGCRL